MHPRKRLSIKSATVTGIAVSALLGLAGLHAQSSASQGSRVLPVRQLSCRLRGEAGVVLRPRPVARAAVRHNAGGNANFGVNRVGARR